MRPVVADGQEEGLVPVRQVSQLLDRPVRLCSVVVARVRHIGPFGRLGEKDLDCALQSAAEMGLELPSTTRLREVVLDLFMNRA